MAEVGYKGKTMSKQIQNISDEGDLRKYRTETPNIIDDLGLDPYEGRLYLHYKRVCGAKGGTCSQSTRTIADITKMSPAKVSIVRRSLSDKGLIEWWEVGQYVNVRIIDIWELNFAYFSVNERPGIDGWTIAQLSKWLESVYVVNTFKPDESQKCLPHKQSVYTVNTSGEKCLPHKTKKEQESKKKQKEGTGPGPLALAILDVCELELGLLDDGLKKEYAGALKFFVDQQTPFNLVIEFRQWWDEHDWRGQQGSSPTIKQFREKWRSFEKWVVAGRPKQTDGKGSTGKPAQAAIAGSNYQELLAADKAQICNPLA